VTFLEAVKEAVEGGHKIWPKNSAKPHLFYDQLTFQWLYVDGVGFVAMPTPEELLGEWETDYYAKAPPPPPDKAKAKT
jgi:hypothetical protein